MNEEAGNEEAGNRWPSRLWQAGRAVVSVTLGVLLLVFGLPRLTGATWSEISAVLGRLTAVQLALLTLVWAIGLLGYTWVLTGGLPGLTHAQALTLNLSSSAVSNLVPFGGALGVAVSYAMVRSWGFGAAAFALSTLVTGIWNVLAKLALPVLALLALLIFREVTDWWLVVGAGGATLALAFVAAALVGALSSERVALLVGRTAEAVAVWARRFGRRFGRRIEPQLGPQPGPQLAPGPDAGEGVLAEVLHLRHRTVGLVRGRWPHLIFGMAAFLGAQAFLQWLCLRMLGSGLSPVQVFAGFAFGRLLTSLVVTPGGVGISETGAAGLLVAFGGDPDVTASGVLLFGGFAYFLEIWAGGAGYAMWALRPSWRCPVPSAEPGNGSAGADGRIGG